MEVPVFLRNEASKPAGHAARDDADLVRRVGVRQHVADESVASLVIGDYLALFLADNAALALRSGDHAVDGFVELGHLDLLLAAASGEDRAFVDQVCEVGAREARSLLGQNLQTDIAVQRLALRVDLKNRLAAADVRLVEHDLAVEAAGPQEGRVEDVGPVGGGDDDDVRAGVEAVHLNENLVERLLSLIVAAAEPGAAVSTDGVDLVDEDDARGVALGLVEEVAHAGCAHADEHLDELRTTDREERHARLTRDGLREKRLARTWRADEQHSLWNAGTERGELLRVLEELDDFLQFFLWLINAGDVQERHAGTGAAEHAGAALAEVERLVIGALRLPQEDEDDAEDDDDRQEADHQADVVGPGAILLDVVLG